MTLKEFYEQIDSDYKDAVSYTHLDVYKRQGVHLPVMRIAITAIL